MCYDCFQTLGYIRTIGFNLNLIMITKRLLIGLAAVFALTLSMLAQASGQVEASTYRRLMVESWLSNRPKKPN